MIDNNKFVKNEKEYDRRISPSDWRYSSAIVGMIRFFKHFNIDYEMENQYVYYNYSSVNNENDTKYLEYAEYRYKKDMHHTVLENLLDIKEKNDEVYKGIKDKLSGNVIMKKIFKDIKENDEPDIIQQLINEKREEIISNTFKNAKYGYKKFLQDSQFRNESGKMCRLLGYYTDPGKKTKMLSFGFNETTRKYSDAIEFDFIPFAFTMGRESIFVNNNFSINHLVKANDKLDMALKDEKSSNFRSKLFYSFQEGSDFVDYDVEIILKSMDKDFFETMFVRKEAIMIFKEIRGLNYDNISKTLRWFIRITDNYNINIMEVVTDNILNLVTMDELIIFLLNHNERVEREFGFLISQLVRINRLIYKHKFLNGDDSMNYKMAYLSARGIKSYFKKRRIEHKLDSYRSKLIAALAANDQNRFFDIMLQLSSYSQTPVSFLHELHKDFNRNKNVAYDFVNQLNYFEFEKDESNKEDN